MSSRSIRAAAGGLVLILSGCSQDPPTVATPPRAPVNFTISDALHSAGNARFFFLPPLVPQPNATGTVDATVSPVVEVCEWTGACGPVIASFSTTGGTGASTVRLDQGTWLVNWDTKACVTGPCTLDPAKTYRIRVLVAGVQLGFADVDVVSNGSQLKNVQTAEYIGLVNGRTLPVKFRIEVGAIHVIPTGGGGTPITAAEGGTVATADGGVVLQIPAGALPGSTGTTLISVAPVANPSPDPNVVAGTTFAFGPDGTQFGYPVTVQIAYSPAALPPEAPESNLRLFTLTQDGWALVPASHVDQVNHLVIGSITHFSDYALGGAIPVAKVYSRDPVCDDVGVVDPGFPQGGRGEVGLGYAPWVWLRGAGNENLSGREITVSSSNPNVVRIDAVQTSPSPACGDAGDPQLAISSSLVGVGEAWVLITSEGITDSVPIAVTGPTVRWNIVPYTNDPLRNPDPHFGGRLTPCSAASSLPTLHVGDTVTAMVEGCDATNHYTGPADPARNWQILGDGWLLESDCGTLACDPGVVEFITGPLFVSYPTLVARVPGRSRLGVLCGPIGCTTPAPADITVLPPS